MCRVLLHWHSKHSCHEGELGEDAGRCVGGRWLSGDGHVTLRCVGGWWLSGDGHVTLRCVGGWWLSGDGHVTLRCVGGWWLSGDGHVTLGRCVGGRWLSVDGHVTLRCVGGRWLSGDGHVTLACFTAAESPKMSSFWSGLDSSGWFSHIKDILDASVFIANVSTYRHL